MRTLTQKTPSIFISHSSQDVAIARAVRREFPKLVARLTENREKTFINACGRVIK